MLLKMPRIVPNPPSPPEALARQALAHWVTAQ